MRKSISSLGILLSAVLAIWAITMSRGTDTVRSTSERSAISTVALTTSSEAPAVTPQASQDLEAHVSAAPLALSGGTGATPTQGSPGAEAKEEEAPFPGSHVDPKVLLALHGNQPLNRQHPHIAAAIDVQERYTARLMAHPAVVGTSVGLNDDGQVAIVVLTKSAAGDLPRALENIPVIVWQSGAVYANHRLPQEQADAQDRARAFGKPGGGGSGGTTLTPRSRYPRPVPIGISTSVVVDYTLPYITAGTLGCRVTDGTNVFALSCNHVYANEGVAPIGAGCLQPGTLDGGTPPADQIGTLSKYSNITFTTPASNVVDAAIVLTTTSIVATATPTGGYGKPSATTAAAFVGMPVTKYGRTTGSTSASVSGINTTVVVAYDHGNAQFVNQVLIVARGFSSAGDSGSLIVQQGNNNPVGLLFAGGSRSTFANPIDPVLSAMGVSIDNR